MESSIESSSGGGRHESDIEALAEFFRIRDINVVKQDRFLWYASARLAYQCLPVHLEPDRLCSRLDDVFRHPTALAARFTTARPIRSETSAASAVYVKSDPFDLGALSANTRSKIRRGQRQCTVERVDPATLADIGLPLSASTAERQGAHWGRGRDEWWRRMCWAAGRSPVHEAWTARTADCLAALAMCFRVDGTLYISDVCSDAESLAAYPNNALVAAVLHDALARPEIHTVCYGMASLDASTSGLHQFKTSMGFQACAVYDNVVVRFEGGLGSLVRPLVSAVAERRTSHRIRQLSGALDRVHSRRDVRRWPV